MSYQEGKAILKFKEFLEIWRSRDKDTTKKINSMLDKEFTGFGRYDVYTNPVDLVAYLEREIVQIPQGWDIIYHQINEVAISEGIIVVNAEVVVTVHYDKRDVNFDRIRISAVFRKRNNQYLIINWHASVRGLSNEDETFPGSKEPKRYEEITVIFTDFVGFTNVTSTIPASKLVDELNELFILFDEVSDNHNLDKIKTIGDSYMLAGGLNESINDHAVHCVKWSKEIIERLQKRNIKSGIKWDIRIGIHTGTAVGGIIGKDKLMFDLWGDTINIASKLEKESEPNRINISAYTYDLVKDTFQCEYRGKLGAKGKGTIDMYFVK